MGNRHIPFSLLALLLAATVVNAYQAVGQANSVDDFIKAEMKRQRIPGLSLVVVKDGRVIKKGP